MSGTVTAVAVGDVNGDGRADIVAASKSQGSILLQDPSHSGRFEKERGFQAGPEPAGVAIADLNGDGKNDIAVANNLSKAMGVTLLLQRTGAEAGFLKPVSVGLGVGASSVAIGDLNNDGLPDLVATIREGVFVLLQEPTEPGSFSKPATFLAGFEPRTVAIGNLDGDPLPDLVVSDQGAPSGVFILFSDADRPGSFRSPVRHSAGGGASGVALGDVNGDGLPDLVVSNRGEPSRGVEPHVLVGAGYSILLQDPARRGTFIAAEHHPMPHGVTSVLFARPAGGRRASLIILDSQKGPLLLAPGGDDRGEDGRGRMR